jgi:DNA-binding HxlR family transcriptional regulator
MDGPHRSGCPINLSLEVFGDRWSLIILRDMTFTQKGPVVGEQLQAAYEALRAQIEKTKGGAPDRR